MIWHQMECSKQSTEAKKFAIYSIELVVCLESDLKPQHYLYQVLSSNLILLLIYSHKIEIPMTLSKTWHFQLFFWCLVLLQSHNHHLLFWKVYLSRVLIGAKMTSLVLPIWPYNKHHYQYYIELIISALLEIS